MKSTKLGTIVLLGLLCSAGAWATEYWSWGGGNWTTTSTWAYWNGSTWVTATSLPDSADGVQLMNSSDTNPITLASGNTANIDYLYMGSGGDGEKDQLDIYGTLDIDNAGGSGYNSLYFGNWGGSYDADSVINVYSGGVFDPGTVYVINGHTSAVHTLNNHGGIIAYVTAVTLNNSKLVFKLYDGETYIAATSISGASSSTLAFNLLDPDALLVMDSTLLTTLINAGCVLANGTTVTSGNRSALLEEDTTYSPWIYVSLAAASAPGAATNPSPANSATSVSVTTDLSWTAGTGATSHNVYFGTTNPPPSIGNQAGTTYDPGTMADNTTYYWRIDEVNSYGTTTGAVWSFTTAAAIARLAVAADGHTLTYNGQPIKLIGDSLTQGWMECGFTTAETTNYIDALASRGINVLMIWTFIASSDARQASDNRIGYNSPERWPWYTSGGVFNLGVFNQTYFDDLEALVAYAQSHDIMVLITVQDGWTKDRWSDHPFNTTRGGPCSSNADYVTFLNYNAEMSSPGTDWRQKNQYYQEQFTIKLIDTVGDYPNVMFEVSNEGEWYNQTNYRAYNVHLADVIKDRTDALVLVNDDHIGGTNFRSEPDCDIISLHKPLYSTSSTAYSFFSTYATEFYTTPAKPQFFSEPVPEWQGDAGLIETVMRVMWGTVLGRGGFVMQNDASFGWDTSCLMAVEATDRDTMYDRIGHCARFFNTLGIDWSVMSPYYYAAGQGSAYSSCLSYGGSETVAYFQAPTSASVWVYVGPNQTRNYRFYNPYWGNFETSGQVTADANGYATLAVPYLYYDSVVHIY